MTKLVNTEFHDNHGVVISGGNNQVTIVMKDGEIQSFNEQPKQTTQTDKKNTNAEKQYAEDLPKENKYADAARWVRKMKDKRDFIREANHNMEQLGRILSPIFGWQVEGHQLKKALYRNP